MFPAPHFPLTGEGRESLCKCFFLDFTLFTNVTLQTVTSSSLMCFELGREQTIYANLALYNLCVLPCQKWDTSLSPPKPPNYAQLSHSWVSGLVTLRGDGKKTFQLPKVFGALLCCYQLPQMHHWGACFLWYPCGDCSDYFFPEQNCFLVCLAHGFATWVTTVFCLGMLQSDLLQWNRGFGEEKSCSCTLFPPNWN